MRRVIGFERLENRTAPASLFAALAGILDDDDESGTPPLKLGLADREDDTSRQVETSTDSNRAFAVNAPRESGNDTARRLGGDRLVRNGDFQTTRVNELFVENFPDKPDHIIGRPTGRAALERSDDSISLRLRTRGLEPGHAYTVWWVVFNNPEQCVDGCFLDEITAAQEAAENGTEPPPAEVSVLYAAGAVANARGRAVFRAELAENDATGPVLFGPTLTDAQGSEVHAVVRTHGPASDDPAVLEEQLTTFNGGCPPNTCTDIQVGVFPAPGAA